MNNSQPVYIKSGEQPRAFVFGNPSARLNSTIAVANSQPIYKESVYSSFQAIITGTGALTGTVLIQGSNDDNTGRGFVFGTNNAPGAPVSVVAASPTMTAQGVTFPPAIVGFVIDAPGVPAGTTVTAVAAGGASLTMSANATVSGNPIQANFLASNWLATPLGTITLTGAGSGATSLNGISDGFTTTSPWRYVRASVTAITGTGASISVNMGV